MPCQAVKVPHTHTHTHACVLSSTQVTLPGVTGNRLIRVPYIDSIRNKCDLTTVLAQDHCYSDYLSKQLAMKTHHSLRGCVFAL